MNTEFDSLLIRNKYDYLFYQFNLYKYNKKFFNIIAGNLRDEKKYNGYSPLQGSLDKKPSNALTENFVFDKDLLEVTKRFILKT